MHKDHVLRIVIKALLLQLLVPVVKETEEDALIPQRAFKEIQATLRILHTLRKIVPAVAIL